MSAAEFRHSVTIPAVPEQVRAVRVFVARVLGESRVDSDVVLLLASELVTNSVLHSGSAVPSGVVTVTVAVGDEVIRVEVTDRCGGSVPVLPAAAPADDEGRAAGDCGWWTRCRRGGATSGTAGSRRRGSSSGRAEPGLTWRVPAMDLGWTSR